MLNERELSAAIGATAQDADGDRIGTVEHFFVDDRTGAPTWVAVTTGLFGTRQSVVPALDATFADGRLRLPVAKEAVKSAPQVGDRGHLDPAEEAELRRHYGLTGAAAATDASPVEERGEPESEPAGGRHAAPETGERSAEAWSPTETSAVPVGAVRGGDEPPGPVAVPEHEVAAARSSGSDGAMTRSEERLVVGTERAPDRRVRLVKYVVTEEVQVTVPIRREEVRLEEVPLDGGPAADEEFLVPPTQGSGAGLPDEIVLHAERPVVGVEVVPVERVRLRTEVVEGQERVTERLQREEIALDES